MANTEIVTGSGGIDVRDFKKFAGALRKTAPEINKELRLNLRAAGEIVAEKMRARTSAFSTKIPGTVKTRVAGAGVSVVVGGKKAPNAAPFDNHGNGGTFRHPVFGNRKVWVEQQAHPFLKQSLEEGKPAAQQAAVNALDDAVKRVVELTR